MHYIDHFGAYMGVMCNVWRHIMHVNVPDDFIISTSTLHSCIQAIKIHDLISYINLKPQWIYTPLILISFVKFTKCNCTYIVYMKTKQYFCIVFPMIISIARLLIMCRFYISRQHKHCLRNWHDQWRVLLLKRVSSS